MKQEKASIGESKKEISKNTEAEQSREGNIPSKTRICLDKIVITYPEELTKISEKDKKKAEDLVNQFGGSVFDENKGRKIRQSQSIWIIRKITSQSNLHSEIQQFVTRKEPVLQSLRK